MPRLIFSCFYFCFCPFLSFFFHLYFVILFFICCHLLSFVVIVCRACRLCIMYSNTNTIQGLICILAFFTLFPLWVYQRRISRTQHQHKVLLSSFVAHNCFCSHPRGACLLLLLLFYFISQTVSAPSPSSTPGVPVCVFFFLNILHRYVHTHTHIHTHIIYMYIYQRVTDKCVHGSAAPSGNAGLEATRGACNARVTG